MSAALALQTVRFGLGGLALYLPLFWLLPSSLFCASRRAVFMGASLFWFAFTTVLVHLAWTDYYRFFYPKWMQWGAALVAAAIYSVYAFGCHWLSCHLPGLPMLWFCLFTGLLAANEHLIARRFARLPEKVPMLKEMPLGSTILRRKALP